MAREEIRSGYEAIEDFEKDDWVPDSTESFLRELDGGAEPGESKVIGPVDFAAGMIDNMLGYYSDGSPEDDESFDFGQVRKFAAGDAVAYVDEEYGVFGVSRRGGETTFAWSGHDVDGYELENDGARLETEPTKDLFDPGKSWSGTLNKASRITSAYGDVLDETYR
jgi:hypothetical protein